MSEPNLASRLVYQYESTPGEAAITGATNTTFEFGHFSDECDKWTLPHTINPTQPRYKYSERTPLLTDLEKEFPPIDISFHPTTAQHAAMILKNPQTGTPITITPLHTGMTYPITIRMELLEGTVPRMAQAVGCYCTSAYVRGMEGSRLLTKLTFNYQALEDFRGKWIFNDVAASVHTGNKEITLTTTGGTLNQYAGYLVWVYSGDNENDVYTVVSNTAATPTVLTVSEVITENLATDKIRIFNKLRPFLTKQPYSAGSDDTYEIEKAFNGKPHVVWDKNGADIDFDCWLAEHTISQISQTASKNEGREQDVTTYQYQPIPILLTAFLETRKQWTDYLDREVRDLEIKYWKTDMVNYISYIFTNCRYKDHIETGFKNKSYYQVVILLEAESVSITNNFLNENPDNFSNHFKAEVT